MKLKRIWQDLIIIAIAIPTWIALIWLIDNARPVMTIIIAMLIGYGIGKIK